MIDHMSLRVRDYAASKAFYEKVLGALGYGVIMEYGEGVGMGPKGKPALWLAPMEGTPPAPDAAKQCSHLAFVAHSRAEVDAFYQAALAAGGTDNGPPGLRPHYHPNYYAAFVFDLDGNNIEAVIHRPE
jgi:catechol 2,3-dioxygenase-like lactoylglutathione lyase family enzyme